MQYESKGNSCFSPFARVQRGGSFLISGILTMARKYDFEVRTPLRRSALASKLKQLLDLARQVDAMNHDYLMYFRGVESREPAKRTRSSNAISRRFRCPPWQALPFVQAYPASSKAHHTPLLLGPDLRVYRERHLQIRAWPLSLLLWVVMEGLHNRNAPPQKRKLNRPRLQKVRSAAYAAFWRSL